MAPVYGIRPRVDDSVRLPRRAPIRQARCFVARNPRTWIPIYQAYQWHHGDFVRTKFGDTRTYLSERKCDERCGRPSQSGKHSISRRKGWSPRFSPFRGNVALIFALSWKAPSLYAKSREAEGVVSSFYLTSCSRGAPPPPVCPTSSRFATSYGHSLRTDVYFRQPSTVG